MLLLLFTGAALWLTYGIFDTDIPVIVANSGVLILISILIAVKIRSDSRS